MIGKTALAAAVVAFVSGAPLALGQDTTTTTADTPAQLLEALKAAGYDVSNITSVNEDGTVSITVPAEAAAELEALDEGAAEETGEGAAELVDPPVAAEPAPEWDFKLTMGFGISQGNSDNANFFGSFLATYETDVTKFIGEAAYFNSEDSGESSENSAFIAARQDWNLDDRWIFFADARGDYDMFKSWRYRVQGHVGVGYRLITEEDFRLTPRVGIGASKEFGSDDNRIIPEALAGVDLEWDITENQSFVASTYYYPNLLDIGEFRWTVSAGWNIKIDQADGLSLTVGLLNEYDSDVDPGIEHNDFKLFGGLAFDF